LILVALCVGAAGVRANQPGAGTGNILCPQTGNANCEYNIDDGSDMQIAKSSTQPVHLYSFSGQKFVPKIIAAGTPNAVCPVPLLTHNFNGNDTPSANFPPYPLSSNFTANVTCNYTLNWTISGAKGKDPIVIVK